jgi:hypothetical protein
MTTARHRWRERDTLQFHLARRHSRADALGVDSLIWPPSQTFGPRCKGGSMGGMLWRLVRLRSMCLKSRPRLSCTLSILAVSRPREVILRERIVVEVPLRDFVHIAYRRRSPVSGGSVVLPKASLIDEASNARADHPGRQDGAGTCCLHSE